jgi:hypothetical protein
MSRYSCPVTTRLNSSSVPIRGRLIDSLREMLLPNPVACVVANVRSEISFTSAKVQKFLPEEAQSWLPMNNMEGATIQNHLFWLTQRCQTSIRMLDIYPQSPKCKYLDDQILDRMNETLSGLSVP